MAENYLSTVEAAQMLDVSPARVRQFIKEGRLPLVRIGRMYVLPESRVRDMPRSTVGKRLVPTQEEAPPEEAGDDQ